MHFVLWDVREHMGLDRNDTSWIWSSLPHLYMYLNNWSPGTGILGSWGSRLLGNRVFGHSSVLLGTWSLFYLTHWVMSNLSLTHAFHAMMGLAETKFSFILKDWNSNWSSLTCLLCAFVCPVVVIFRVLILRQIFVLIPLSRPDATSVLHLPSVLCIVFLYWIFPTLRALYFLYTAISFQSLSQPLSFQVLPTFLCLSKTNKGPAHSCMRPCCPPLKTITNWEKFSLGCECTVKWSTALVVPAINTCLLVEHYNL